MSKLDEFRVVSVVESDDSSYSKDDTEYTIDNSSSSTLNNSSSSLDDKLGNRSSKKRRKEDNNEEEEDSNDNSDDVDSEKTILLHKRSRSYSFNKRQYWADCARIFSMLAVILLHCACYDLELDTKAKNDSCWIVILVYNCLTRFGVPVFVLLSGTFILDPSRPFSFEKLFRRSILRLVTAYIFWSFVNAIFYIFSDENAPSLFSLDFLGQFFIRFVGGQEYLWFIYMIVGCYLISPFLRYFSDDVIMARYFLVLALFFGSLLPSLYNLFGALRMEAAADGVQIWINRWHFHFTLEFVGYFVAGYHFVKYVDIKSVRVRFFLYLFTIVDIIFIICGTYYAEVHDPNNDYSHHFRGTNCITIVYYSMVVFIFFKHEVSEIRLSKKAINIITKWSSLTFGMYLSHLIFRDMLAYFFHISQTEFLGVIKYSPVIGIPILWVILTVLSTIFSYVVSNIPILKDYII